MKLSFLEELDVKGHLTISKVSRSGAEEIIFDDHNVIVSGMGVALAHMFALSGSDSILDYQIDRFQVGVSGLPANETVSRNQLVGPLSSFNEYGFDNNLVVASGHHIINNSVVTNNRIYCLIPQQNISRIDANTVRYTLVLDEFAANNLVRNSVETPLSEIGLFIKNPKGQEPDASILVAYRTFSDIYKTEDFSLVFRWSINF
jgi:hypothetical protein